ncbi:MAG: thioredoxin domain-containing protein [Candidatus Babeliales bacterium]
MVTHCSLSVLVFMAGSLCTITPEAHAGRGRNTQEQSAGTLIEVRDATEINNYITPGKPYVLGFFMIPGCGHCTTAHPKVESLAQKNPDVIFLSLNVNGTKNIGTLKSKYDINAYPTFLFFDGNGTQLAHDGQTKMAGFASEDAFNARLNAIRKGVQPTPAVAEKVNPHLAQAPKMVAQPQPMPHAKPAQSAAHPQRPHMRPQPAGSACPPAARPAGTSKPKRNMGSAASNMIELGSEQELNGIYKEHSHVALLFSTPWCGMCPGMKPKYTQMAQEFSGVFFVNVNGDHFKSLVHKLQVTGYPCAVLMKNGKEVDRVRGGGHGIPLLRSKFKSFVGR